MSKLDLIITLIEKIAHNTTGSPRYIAYEALTAARELRALKPVGELFLGGIDTNGEYDGCDIDFHMSVIEALQEKLVKSDPIKLPLYALGESNE
jgi:hypothetical protein